MTRAATSSGEMNVSLKDPYVNMENRANYILWKKKVLTTFEASSVARDQKMRTANFSYGTMYSSDPAYGGSDQNKIHCKFKLNA